MTDNELDQILSRELSILPSAGFVRSVMEGVRLEAVAPPPLPVPWSRVLAGLAAWAIALVALLVNSFDQFSRPGEMPEVLSTALAKISAAVTHTGTAWLGLALLVTLAAVAIPTVLTRRSDLSALSRAAV